MYVNMCSCPLPADREFLFCLFFSLQKMNSGWVLLLKLLYVIFQYQPCTICSLVFKASLFVYLCFTVILGLFTLLSHPLYVTLCLYVLPKTVYGKICLNWSIPISQHLRKSFRVFLSGSTRLYRLVFYQYRLYMLRYVWLV